MTAVVDDVRQRLRQVHRPQPILGRERALALTDRQRQLLDEMEHLFAGGFADLTMAEQAARLNCSLRTLYALAPSRDELVLIVVDRHLWRVGRAARDALRDDLPPLDAVRSYLEAATVAVSGWTEAFARDLETVPAARQLEEGHNEYLFEVTRTLLDLALERGDIADVDTAAVARVLAGLGRFFSRPWIIPTLRSSPKEAADAVVDLVLRGLDDRMRIT
ncbi:MAG: TetR/AcrR family transcriptional regulator [Acidimicrobiales bacterium]